MTLTESCRCIKNTSIVVIQLSAYKVKMYPCLDGFDLKLTCPKAY